MLPLRFNSPSSAALAVALAFSIAPGDSQAQERGSGFLALQRWLHAADVAANEAVTYEICGWGVIDLRTPFLAAAIKDGVDATAWDELAERFDNAVRERRQTEAVLTAHGANAPSGRTRGLHATGGCTDAVRGRIVKMNANGIGDSNP